MPSIEQLEREVKALRALAMYFARQIPEAAKAAKGEIRRTGKRFMNREKKRRATNALFKRRQRRYQTMLVTARLMGVPTKDVENAVRYCGTLHQRMIEVQKLLNNELLPSKIQGLKATSIIIDDLKVTL